MPECKTGKYKHSGFICCQSVVKALSDLTDIGDEILNKFQKYSGATLCKDLKERDSGVVLCGCDDCICNAIRAFDEVVEK